jgi:hypothetical protein
MADQIVRISLFPDPLGGKPHARPAPAKLDLEVGHSVTYEAADAKDQFEVIFDGSPFNPHPFVIRDSTPLIVMNPGRTFCKCFIIRNGQRFGWRPDEDPQFESGGDHDVKP